MVILGVDLGKARTGLAACDPGEILASPVRVIAERDRDRLLEAVAAEASARRAERLVVGLPRNMDGSEGESAQNAGRRGGIGLLRGGRPDREAGETRFGYAAPAGKVRLPRRAESRCPSGQSPAAPAGRVPLPRRAESGCPGGQSPVAPAGRVPLPRRAESGCPGGQSPVAPAGRVRLPRRAESGCPGDPKNRFGPVPCPPCPHKKRGAPAPCRRNPAHLSFLFFAGPCAVRGSPPQSGRCGRG